MALSKKSEDIVFLLSVLLMTLALFARDLFGYNIPKMYFVAFSVVPAVLMSHASLVYYLFFLFPLTSGLPGNYIFPLLIVLLLTKNGSQPDRGGIMCFVVLAFMEVLHFATYNFSVSWSATVGYLSDLFLVFYLVTLKNDSVDARRCVLSFCFGLAVFLFAIFYITHINGSVEMLLEGQGRIGDTKSLSETEQGAMMLNANPNGLGFFSIVGFASVVVLYMLKKINLVVLAVFSIIYLYVGSLGVSRTFLFSLAVMVILLFFFRGRQQKSSTSWSRYFLLFLFIAVAFFALFNNASIFDAYTRRLTDASTDTMGDRTVVFAMYNKFLFENPLYLLIGTGAVHYGMVIDSIPISTHNAIQQIVVSYGLIGLAFFIYISIAGVKKCYKKGLSICLVPFLTALLYVQGGQLLNPSHNLYLFIVTFFIMKLSIEPIIQK